jgi:quaternary ammonium compound-resistance protein SugE
MAWTYLLVASGFEILFALGLKDTEGFTRVGWSVLTVAAGVASFLILSQALKTLPVGTGYAMWTGIGAVGATILGILFFHEPRDAGRLVSIGLIISGIVGHGGLNGNPTITCSWKVQLVYIVNTSCGRSRLWHHNQSDAKSP